MEKAKFFVFIAYRKHVICQIKIHVLTWMESPVPLQVLFQLDFWCKDRPAWHPCQLLVEM